MDCWTFCWTSVLRTQYCRHWWKFDICVGANGDDSAVLGPGGLEGAMLAAWALHFQQA